MPSVSLPVPASDLRCRLGLLLATLILLGACSAASSDPLAAWRPGAAKDRITEFVAASTAVSSPAYIAPSERVAVFDNDGTLWSEQPWPVPFEFIFYRIRQLSVTQPDWQLRQPYKAVLEADYAWLRQNNRKAIRELSAVAQAGLSVEEYDAQAREFLATARHPETGLLYTEMVYAPMLQLVRLLQAKQYQVYVVSGGDTDFIRAYAEEIYGIPRSHVIGSRVGYKVTEAAESLVLIRQADTESVNIGGFKVVNIHAFTGRRPVVAVGNSDGDLEMLQFPDSGSRPSLSLLLVHDDPAREFHVDAGYDRAREAAEAEGWLVVSMRDDFAAVFAAARVSE